MELQQEITTLAAQLGAILTDKRLTITTAESCTGGGISFALTDTPGSSAYVDRCFVTYSNQAKHELLGVPLPVLAQYGAVSKQTVREMAQGAAHNAKADIAVAVSGVAGPGGGSAEKPVGLVWFAFYILGDLEVKKCIFSGDRTQVRMQVIAFAIDIIINKFK
ncbi:CinA family protein [Pseudoalteromonas aurantia]|uniref:Damage-inducible protein CinA n=1 Tax=Pseudoalteromonas aurantia TaxID=43654 RepID=A0A5S3V9T9_9GAMM|nr:nicotinamide-nucleotide amidohydrolase family protein [Pseudoalteromonas aurantia]TMO60034.1 damage-inducible protein CinA [Pseudoalteromonas aurantia]TMO68468.1 damage-inducible protein CinA [Pseudoalteromonas aurantia]TMO71401.1 damage-inducible protein CinA [Pseudoalteromonas aurantia]